jgi:hypothetical protein
MIQIENGGTYMPKPPDKQPDVAADDTGTNGLLVAHRAVSTAWFSNWRAEQAERLDKLMTSRYRYKTDEHPDL